MVTTFYNSERPSIRKSGWSLLVASNCSIKLGADIAAGLTNLRFKKLPMTALAEVRTQNIFLR